MRCQLRRLLVALVKAIGVVLLPYFGLFLAPLVSPLAFAVTVGILLGFGLGLEF